MSPMQFLERLGPSAKGAVQTGVDIRGFAERHNMTYLKVYRQITGQHLPTLPVMVAFYVESGGKVGLSDWITLAMKHKLIRKPKKRSAKNARSE